MTDAVKLNRLDRTLAAFDYPLAHEAAVRAGGDVTLVLADGETNLGETIAAAADTEFSSADDLHAAVMSLLPRNAVGEPYQSDGDS